MNIYEVPQVDRNSSRYFNTKTSAFLFAKRKGQPVYRLELIDTQPWHILITALNGINIVVRKSLVWAPPDYMENIPDWKDET